MIFRKGVPVTLHRFKLISKLQAQKKGYLITSPVGKGVQRLKKLPLNLLSSNPIQPLNFLKTFPHALLHLLFYYTKSTLQALAWRNVN